jgi:NADPH:quinone reductase
MRAVRFDRYGDRDVLYVADVPIPQPGPGEALVEVRAAGINPGEASIRKGFLADRFPATFPSGQGTDLAGVVTAVGEGVTGFAPGDEVLGWSWARSSQAEYVTVPVTQLVPKPVGLSWEVAGSLNVAGATAWAAVAAVDPQPGETVVVSAAAGGVGSIAVQLVRMRDAIVIGIASEDNHAWLLAHDVIPVEYGDGLQERIRAAAPRGVQAFIDTFGPEYIDLAVALGVPPDRIDTIISFERAAAVGARTEGSAAGSTPEVMSALAELAADGRLEVPIAATFPLGRVQDAFAELEQGHTRGKIVLIP